MTRLERIVDYYQSDKEMERLRASNVKLAATVKDLTEWLESITLGDGPKNSIAKAREILKEAKQ